MTKLVFATFLTFSVFLFMMILGMEDVTLETAYLLLLLVPSVIITVVTTPESKP